MATHTTRRALIGGAGLAGVVLIAPALAVTPYSGSPTFRAIMDANGIARNRFNSLPENLEHEDGLRFEREETLMHEAYRAADHAVPTTWAEFTRLLDHHSDGGVSMIDDDNGARLLAHAKRLLSAGALA